MMKIYDASDNPALEVEVDDTSYRSKRLMGENVLELHYALPEYKELPVGSWCEFEGERYTLESPQNFTVQSEQDYRYKVVMYGAQWHLRKYRLRDTTVQNRLKFSYTGTPLQFLRMIVENMNRREAGWSVGGCIEASERTVTFNHSTCLEALQSVADEFSTEWEVAGRVIHLRRVEYNKESPLPLRYGEGGGFLPGVGRENYGSPPAEILFVQGGSRNLDVLAYGSTELLLPKSQRIRFDGTCFEGDAGFDASSAREYETDSDGLSLHRSDKPLSSYTEDSVDLSDIYPSRVGTVTAVETVAGTDSEGNAVTFYDIVDSSIPGSLDFGDCLIEGETLSVIFQTGKLAGREFDAGYVHADRRFELVPSTMDGAEMPSDVFPPSVGDKYAVFGCMLPEAYICDNASKTGASWDMFREAVRVLYSNEDQQYSFTGEMDGIWSSSHWLDVGGRLTVGGYVSFSSDTFVAGGSVAVRIVGIKTYVNRPKKPVLELSDRASGGTSLSAALKRLSAEEVVREAAVLRTQQSLGRRTYAQAKELQGMLERALEGFTGGVTPVWVRTMSVLVGNEGQQFEFVDKKTEGQKEVVPAFSMDNASKVFTAPAAILKHCTLGIESTSSSHKADEYRYWDVAAYQSPALTDGGKAYYLTAKCLKEGASGAFVLEEEYSYDPGDGSYHFLVGVLSSEQDGERSYASCYGYTEILPGQMRIKMIVSPDGNTYFNVAEGEIGGKIRILSGSSGYDNLTDKPDLSIYETVADFNVKYNQISGQVSRIDASLGGTQTDLSNLNAYVSDQITRINGDISAAQGDIAALQTAGFITTAQGNTLYAAKTDMTGNNIVSLINQTATTVTIQASKINLTGAVTFSMLDKATVQNRITGVESAASSAATAAGDAQSGLATLTNKLGAMAYEDVVEKAKLGTTVVQGGYLRTDLIQVRKIVADDGTIGGISIYENSLGTVSEDSTAAGVYMTTDMLRYQLSGGETVSSMGLRKPRTWTQYMSGFYSRQASTIGGTQYRCGLFVHFPVTSQNYNPDYDAFIIGKYGASDTAWGAAQFQVRVSACSGDADGYKRICITASRMPFVANISNQPTLNSGSTNQYYVVWDERTGMLACGKAYS